MNRLVTYAPLDDVTALQLDQLQDAMMDYIPINGYRSGGFILQDDTIYATNELAVSPIRLLIGTFAKDLCVVPAFSSVFVDVGSGWHYLYAAPYDAVTAVYYDSTTAPDAALVYKNGDVSLRYVASYAADGTDITPVYNCGTSDLYRRSNKTSTRFLAGTLVSTLITVLSGGVSLPQSTIHVTSTTGFATSGTIHVYSYDQGWQDVTYTGVTGTTFTGCAGGTGFMSSGGAFPAGGVSPAWKALSLATLIPPHAHLVHLALDIDNASTAAYGDVGVRVTGDVYDARYRIVPQQSIFTSTEYKQYRFSREVGTTQQVDWEMYGAGDVGIASARLYVTGFEERAY